MLRSRILLGTLAVAGMVVLGAPPAGSAQVQPPVVTITATDGVLTVTGDCDGNETTDLEPATFTLTRTGDTSGELFVDTALGGTIQDIANAAEGITIPAGEATATFEPETGTQVGTVQIDIANTSHPDSFTVGDPASAMAQVQRRTITPSCESIPTSSTVPTTSTTLPPVAAVPVSGGARYTG